MKNFYLIILVILLMACSANINIMPELSENQIRLSICPYGTTDYSYYFLVEPSGKLYIQYGMRNDVDINSPNFMDEIVMEKLISLSENDVAMLYHMADNIYNSDIESHDSNLIVNDGKYVEFSYKNKTIKQAHIFFNLDQKKELLKNIIPNIESLEMSNTLHQLVSKLSELGTLEDV